MSTEWFDNSVIYQIFIDRFAGFESRTGWSKPQFLGGDLQGIINKLDYVEELGVDVIWISPFYETSAYHGYHITDYFTVDSHFGTEEDLEKLIEEVHSRDMKIIADFVPNHCSWKHPYFIDAQENEESRYREWFYFEEWPWNYTTFLDFPQLPKLNLENPETREHLIKASKYWLEKGLDGYRIDHLTGISHDFWEDFSQKIKSDFPDSVLIGEAWISNIGFEHLYTQRMRNKYLKWLLRGPQEWQQKEYIEEMDGMIDFKFQELVRKYIAQDSLHKNTKILKFLLKHHYNKYPDKYYLPAFLDNHDMNRFLYQAGNNREKLKQAAKIQFSTDQPKIIYYGTEVGMTQEHGFSELNSHEDILARKPMDWESQDNELLEFYRNLIKNRTNQH